MLSNSDNKGKDETEGFFDILYKDYWIERVLATRFINCNPNKRGKLSEILVHNYKLGGALQPTATFVAESEATYTAKTSTL